MKISLQEIYDQFAYTYENNRCLFDMTEILNSFYGRVDVKKGNLLDMGCGAGEPFARFFIERGWAVTGVDFSRQMLKMAAKYVPEMRTIKTDMRDVEFAAAEFDAITVIYSLFHIPRDEHAALFEKFHRWLLPGGKVLFTYATKEYTGSAEFDGYKEFMGEELYYSHKNPDTLGKDLQKTGFHVESWEYREIGGETFLWVTAGKTR